MEHHHWNSEFSHGNMLMFHTFSYVYQAGYLWRRIIWLRRKMGYTAIPPQMAPCGCRVTLCSNKAIWLRLKIGYTMIHRYTYTGYSNHDYPDQHGHYSIFRHNKASYVDDSLQTITVTSSECRQTHPFYQWIASRSNACILKGRLSRGSTLKPIAWLLQTRNLDMSSQKMQRVVDAMWFYMFGNTIIYISWYYIVCLYVLLWYGKTYCKEKCDM